VHRLNRAEYANAVRELFGVEIDVAELLPSDGGDFGFDNIASVLTTSPLLLERYLTAALRIADAAIGDVQAAPTAATYKIGVEVTQNQHMDGLPLGTRGGTVVRHNFPADAEYVLSSRLLNTVAEGYAGVEGHDEPHEFIITIDGEQVFSALIGGPEDHAENARDFLASRAVIDERMTSPPLAITAGPHDVGFTWVERPAVGQSVWQPPLRATQEAHNPSGLPRLETASIVGPYGATGVSSTPSRELPGITRLPLLASIGFTGLNRPSRQERVQSESATPATCSPPARKEFVVSILRASTARHSARRKSQTRHNGICVCAICPILLLGKSK
jgi:hypothetical protein